MADYLEDLSISYEHPYIAVYIQDNTVRYDESSSSITLRDFNGIQVGFFPDGRDGTLLYCTSTDAAINEFGQPNFKTHGQAMYNVVRALDTGKCGMYVMNLRANDACFANAVIMVHARVGTLGMDSSLSSSSLPGSTRVMDAANTPKLILSFEKKYIEGATSEAVLKSKIAELYNDQLDDNGAITLPLMAFWKLGRGEVGNKTRIKIVDGTEYDYAQIYHSYLVQVIQPTKTGLSIVEKWNGMVDDSALDITNQNNPSMFIEDIINDLEFGSSKINMMFDMSTLDVLLNMYKSINPESTVGYDTFDCLFGKLIDGTDDQYIVIDTSNGFALDATTGFALEGGSDGSLASTDPATVAAVKDELLVSAFNGEIDRHIVSRFSSPADFCLDAGYSNTVKRAMAGLATARMYDCMTYIDTGLLETTQEIINWGRDMSDVWAYNLVKEAGCYKYRDIKYTGKVTNMTITHYLAKALPNHMAMYGLTEPFARGLAKLNSSGSNPDFMRGSFRPVIDPDMDDLKNALRKLRINNYETVNFNSVQRSDAITTCRENSDRLLEFNEYIVHKAISIAYGIMASRIYKLGEETDRQAYEQQARDEIEYQLGSQVRSCEVKFIMTASDIKKRLMRLQLTIVLKRVITGGAVILILNPNTEESDVATVVSSSSANTLTE